MTAFEVDVTAGRDLSDLRLDDQVAVVTGSGQGIGRAVAVRLAAAGATVVGLDRVPSTATTDLIRSAGGRAADRVCDVADPDGVRAVIADLAAAHGRLDILVNNAGVGSHTLPHRLDPAEFENVVRVNVFGYFFAAQAAHRVMAGRGGAIVNISSIAGSTALGRGNLAYSVSKGAVEQLTRELAVEWATDGIRVNAVAPSQVATEGFAPLLSDPRLDAGGVGSRMLRGVPLARLATPAEIAAAVHFLASGAARFVTGVILPVDGGNTALNAGGTVGSPTVPAAGA